MIAEESLEAATRRLVERFSPEKIILFGSQARGTADKKSDVDLLVVARIEGGRRQLMVAMDRALSGLGFARDVLVCTPEEYDTGRSVPGAIARRAFLEGRVLYESSR